MAKLYRFLKKKNKKKKKMKSLALGIFSIGISLSGLLVITSLKPINAIISLILAFLNGIGLFILLGEDFIGLLYCIIYIGAIVILFLFVIMLLNIQRENLIKSLAFFKATKPMALLIGSLTLLVFSNTLSAFSSGSYSLEGAAMQGDKSNLAISLSQYPFPNWDSCGNYNKITSTSVGLDPGAPEVLHSLNSTYGVNTVVAATAHSTVPTLTIKPTFASIEEAKALSNIGEMLYKEWGYEMLLVLSLILLVGMIGAIVLTFHTKKLSNGN
jgi:NADH:ubiquinone oxidoreductase subunit 6 (subunit J)